VRMVRRHRAARAGATCLHDRLGDRFGSRVVSRVVAGRCTRARSIVVERATLVAARVRLVLAATRREELRVGALNDAHAVAVHVRRGLRGELVTIRPSGGADERDDENGEDPLTTKELHAESTPPVIETYPRATLADLSLFKARGRVDCFVEGITEEPRCHLQANEMAWIRIAVASS